MIDQDQGRYWIAKKCFPLLAHYTVFVKEVTVYQDIFNGIFTII